MSKITIAIDGYSSTGKSTIAKELAHKLGYSYVDTGAMYRAVTLYAIEHNYFDDDDRLYRSLLVGDLNKIEIDFVFNSTLGYGEVQLNGINVEGFIRNMSVSNKVSVVATIPEVRQAMVAQQKKMGAGKGVVMDGRDIGTVVFPDAELKIFMTATSDVRAQRRLDELVSKGDTKVTFEEVKKNVDDRDLMDTSRTESPLVKAKDAIGYDNSNKTKEQQYADILKLVEEKL
ncbi:MAG: (d)CMP kinase [Ichthyobacteriaceae bacterium]|nr:(d)CMP kinase [Ichthyobacteriaceae bacterium]